MKSLFKDSIDKSSVFAPKALSSIPNVLHSSNRSNFISDDVLNSFFSQLFFFPSHLFTSPKILEAYDNSCEVSPSILSTFFNFNSVLSSSPPFSLLFQFVCFITSSLSSNNNKTSSKYLPHFQISDIKAIYHLWIAFISEIRKRWGTLTPVLLLYNILMFIFSRFLF
jgi:hypothetical protein